VNCQSACWFSFYSRSHPGGARRRDRRIRRPIRSEPVEHRRAGRTRRQAILLTGDARGDYVLEGLKAAKVLDRALHLDVLKVPHHGSNRDVEVDFFRRVTANHYVVSANGKYGNPDEETLKMIADARGRDRFTIHLTNHDGEGGLRTRLDAFSRAAKAAGERFEVSYLGEPGPIRIELGDPLGL
jgi:hypothetical protein